MFGRYLLFSLFFSLVAGGSLVAAGLYLASWPQPPAVGADFWTMMQGLCALVATSALLGGGVFTLAQYNHARDERRLGIYNDIFDRLMSEKHVQARRWVYAHVTESAVASSSAYKDFLDTLGDEGRAHIKLSLNTLDHLGFLVECGWLDDERVIHWLHPILIKLWERLGPVIALEKERRQEPAYYEHCDKLARRCQWRRRPKGTSRAARVAWIRDAL